MSVLVLGVIAAVLLLYVGAGVLFGKEKRNQALFKFGYRLYSTPIGSAMHQLTLLRRKDTPHSHFDQASRVTSLNNGNTLIVPLPILGSNYSYLVVDLQSKTGALIDPADPTSVAEQLSKLLPGLLGGHDDQSGARLVITDVLCTHWHFDHSGGSSTLLHWAKSGERAWPPSLVHQRIAISPDLRVFGPRASSTAGITHALEHEQVVHLGPATGITALHTPGHTQYHLCFAIGSAALFSGDLLFASGMGKFFEGTAAEVQHSICSVLAPRVNTQTMIFPGHEYALPNLTFAASLSKNDDIVDEELRRVTQLRRKKVAVIPVTWGSQLTLNPFVRILVSLDFQQQMRQVWKLDAQTSVVELLAHLRLLKNRF